jgi:hypothetical protein
MLVQTAPGAWSRLLAALYFTAFLTGQSPHLVHHALEHQSADSECALAAAVDRAQGIEVELPPVAPDPSWRPAPVPPRQDAPRSPGRGPTEPRAPPPLAV